MALEIIDKKIVGTIDNLEDKLNGEIPVTREDLLVLVSSWGRNISFCTKDSQNKDMYIEECEKKESYDLSKLDVSQITNMEDLFLGSDFTDIHSTNGIGLDNGDISNWNISNVTNMSFMFLRSYNFNYDIENWDTSNVTDMKGMFSYAYNFNQNIGNWDTSRVTNMKRLFNGATIFNQDIGKWDVSNVTNMESMFEYAIKFNQNISLWDLDNVKNIDYMFDETKAFLDKYNNGEPLPNHTDNIKEWFNINTERMNMISIKDQYGEEIDMFFNNFTNIHSINRIGLHD